MSIAPQSSSSTSSNLLAPKDLEKISKAFPFFEKQEEDLKDAEKKKEEKIKSILKNLQKNFDYLLEKNSLLNKNVNSLKAEIDQRTKKQSAERQKSLKLIKEQKAIIEKGKENHKKKFLELIKTKTTKENQTNINLLPLKLSSVCLNTSSLFSELNKYYSVINVSIVQVFGTLCKVNDDIENIKTKIKENKEEKKSC